MSLSAARRARRRFRTVVPVASMGDIAFLLIIFFMVCSNFTREAPVKLTPPDAPGLTRMQPSQVAVAIDERGDVFLQGQRVSGPDGIEWGVAALLEGREQTDQRTVVFNCHRDIGKSVYEPILDAIAKGGGIIAAVGDERDP